MRSAQSSALGNRPAARLSGIEACRGIAAVTVVFYHASRFLDKGVGAPTLRDLFQFGHAGVDFFFVLSGFIILFVHFDDIGNPARLTHYVGRRFTRLMPTYWVALAVSIVEVLAGGHRGNLTLSDVLGSLSLLSPDSRLIVGVAWTLKFELAFYTIFAVLIINRIAGFMVFAAWVSLTVVSLVTPIATTIPSILHAAFNLEFFFGMAAAAVLKNYSVSRPLLLMAVGIILFGTAALLENNHILDGYGNIARLAYGIPAALVVTGVAEANRRSQLAIPYIFGKLGAASYSIYLFQLLFIDVSWQILLAMGFDQRLPVTIQFCAVVLVAVTGAMLVSAWVEYPLMRFVRTRRRRLPAPTSTG